MLASSSVEASARPFSIVSIALFLRFRFNFSQSMPLTAAWNVPGIDGDSKEEAGIGDDEEEEKDGIYNKDANRWTWARRVKSCRRSEEVVDCRWRSAWISHTIRQL